MNQAGLQGLVVIEGRATYEKIVTYIRDVDLEESMRQVQNFLKIYPEFAQAHNDLAVMYYRAGNGMKALAHYEKAHKLEPSNITYRKNLADFYFVELEWADDAIQTYLDILKDNPFDIETLNALGTINVQTGRREQGRQYFTRTLQLDAVNAQARQALQLLGGQLPSSALHVQICSDSVPPLQPAFNPVQLQEPPINPEELHRNALGLVNGGKTHDGRQLLEEIVHHFPGYAPAHNDLGVMCQQEGDLSQARLHHEEALRLQPDNLTFQKNVADLLYIAFNETENALMMYVEILSRNPHDVDTLTAISNICIETGRFDDAKSFLEMIVMIDPPNDVVKKSLAAISELSKTNVEQPHLRETDEIHGEALHLAQQDRVIEAHALLEELVHNVSNNATYQNDLGVLRYRLGDLEGARSAYEQAVTLQPDNSTYQKNLADLYFTELGMIDEAIGVYLELFRQFPRDLEVLAGLGKICEDVGRPEEAKSFYRRVLELEPWNADVRAAMQSLF